MDDVTVADLATTTSLLNFLRINTNVCWDQLQTTIVGDHIHEFPSKLGLSIAKCYRKGEDSMSRIQIEVAKFLNGRSSRWEWLDHNCDTDEEAELAMRFYLLSSDYEQQQQQQQQQQRSLYWTDKAKPIFSFLGHEKAVSFIPLYLKLAIETGYACPLTDVCNNLLVNRDLFQLRKDSEELDEQSLLVLLRLREMGLVNRGLIRNLVGWLLGSAKNMKPNSIGYIEQRLRLLIHWSPSILKNYTGSPSLLLHFYTRYRHRYRNKNVALGIFRVIVELGVHYFSNELGFLFSDSAFRAYCGFYGSGPVGIASNLALNAFYHNHNKKWLDLVLAAATNDKISLDGVYTLLRCDPNDVLQRSVVLSPQTTRPSLLGKRNRDDGITGP